MAMTYRAVMLTRKGGPEVLQVVELPIEQPGPKQLRVRVRAAGVGSTDLAMLAGNYLYAPKIPFVPGYEVAGVVEAIGAGVTGFGLGQRVAALTVHGGFAELLVREAEHFLPIPDSVTDRDAAAVILNYVTAWQMIHRVAKVRPGQTALVTGAAGGVGTAALQLLRLAGVKTYGAASAPKHDTLRSLGATPIDYRTGSIDRLTRVLEPKGVDHAAPTSVRASARCGEAGRWSDLVSWALPECFPSWPRSATFSWVRACVGDAAHSTASLRCTERTPSRCVRICRRSSPSSQRRRSIPSLSTRLRSLRRDKPSSSWRRVLWKARSFL